MVASVAWSAVEVRLRPAVWVLNGTDHRIEVDVGAQHHELGPGEKRRLRVRPGTHRIRAEERWSGHSAFDEGSLEVKDGGEVLVWNPGGAAPVAEQEVVYLRGARAVEGAGSIRCRERVLRLAPADFVFEPPPPTVPFTPGEERIVRKAISLSPESCPAP